MSHNNCDCFFCRNPKIQRELLKLARKINKEDKEIRIVIIKSIVKTLLGATEISLIDRLGLCNVITFEFLAESKMAMLMGEMQEEEKGKVDYIA